MCLTNLTEGTEGIITEVSTSLPEVERRRLHDLGFIVGSKVRHLFSSSFGDTNAYEVMNSVIALRKEQTDRIYIK